MISNLVAITILITNAFGNGPIQVAQVDYFSPHGPFALMGSQNFNRWYPIIWTTNTWPQKGSLLSRTVAREFYWLNTNVFIGSIPEAKIRTASIITEKFLDALALVESSGNAAAVGDGGRARGPFQLWRGAWQDADRNLKLNKSYELYATDPAVSRLYARAFLTQLEARLAAVLCRPPTTEQLYAAWNLGLTGFERRGFLLSRCPQTTQRAAKKLTGYL
jgi:hypothetical protein